MDETLQRRLEEIEIRYAFQEDLLNQLDEVMKAQANQIDALRRELTTLRDQLKQGPQGEANSLEDEKPPHY